MVLTEDALALEASMGAHGMAGPACGRADYEEQRPELSLSPSSFGSLWEMSHDKKNNRYLRGPWLCIAGCLFTGGEAVTLRVSTSL